MAERVGLVGCVKRKLETPAKAKDLYISALFRGRRGFVEASCDSWWILSAKHGLVDPEEVLAPYDLTLKSMGRAERREWAARTLAELVAIVRPQMGDVIEFHAGADYREYGLRTGLEAMGCQIEIPTEHLTMGQQRGFYKNHHG